jgi:hypothetical protein
VGGGEFGKKGFVLGFVHFSALSAWSICPAAKEFYLSGFKNPPA